MHPARNMAIRVPVFPSVTLLLAGLVALGLTACGDGAMPGTPALPPGFQERQLPNVDIRGYLYIDPGGVVSLPESLLSEEASDGETLTMLRLVALLGDTTQRYAASLVFLDEQRGNEPTLEGLTAASASPEWSSAVQSAWQNGTGTLLEEKYPSVWAKVSLLPPDPSSQPVAAGFLRDAAALSESLLGKWGIEVSGLGSALALLRISEVAFVVYADGLRAIPAEVTDDTVRESGLGLVAVASSGYPGTVVDTLVGNFSSLAGLRETLIGEEPVQYRDLEGVGHLMVKAIGVDLFFALAPTRAEVEQLMETVLSSQG
jgi:hypothetical protein